MSCNTRSKQAKEANAATNSSASPGKHLRIKFSDGDDGPDLTNQLLANSTKTYFRIKAPKNVPPEQPAPEEFATQMCHICGQSFNDEKALKKHVDAHVNGSDEDEQQAEPASDDNQYITINKGQSTVTYCLPAGVDLFGDHNTQNAADEYIEFVLEEPDEPKTPGIQISKVEGAIPLPDDGVLSDEDDVPAKGAARGRKRKYESPSSQTVFECEVCNKVYTSYDALRYHRRNHGDKTLSCDDCGKMFRFSHALKLHSRIHTGEKPFLCEVCGKGFAFKHNMFKHVREVHLGQPPSHLCDICGRGFNCKSHLDVHKKRHQRSTPYCFRDKNRKKIVDNDTLEIIQQHVHAMEEPPFICKTCSTGKTYPGWRNLVLHIQRVHIGLPLTHICTDCGKGFDSRGHLELHKRVHSGEQPYACTYCPKTFSGPGNLKSHIRVHTKERPYPCNICGKSFAQSSVRNRHIRVHLGIKPHRCTVCDKSFATRNHLTRHMVMHSNDRSYCCEYCGKRFAYAYNLDLHRRLHTGETPYKCTECDQTFIRSNELARHVRIHTGEKRFCCEFCGDIFLDSMKLRRHIKTHGDVKEEKCTYCKEVFADRDSLKEHVQKEHANARPHSCRLCARRFKTEAALTKHAEHIHKKHLEDLVCFVCETCDEQFNTDTEVRIHMRDKHKENIDLETEAERDLRNSKIDELISAVTAVTEGLKGKKAVRVRPGSARERCNILSRRKSSRRVEQETAVMTILEHNDGYVETSAGMDETVVVYCDSDNIVDQMPSGVSEIVVIESTDQIENQILGIESEVGRDQSERREEVVVATSANGVQEQNIAEQMDDGTSSYHCENCNLHFPSYDSLISHLLTHAGKESFIVKILDGDEIKIILTDKVPQVV